MSIKKHACAVGKVIGPKSIKFISRKSNGKVCIHLDRKKPVTSLTTNNTIEIKPILTPAQRIILSNVPPIIPNSTIENTFKQNNV